MKARWEQLAARINGLNTRERIFLFVSLLVCLLALADTFWLSPAQNSLRQLSQQFTAQSAELEHLRMDLALNSKARNTNQAVHAQIAEVQQRIDAVNHDIEQYAPTDTAGQNGAGSTGLEQVLVEFLRQQKGLTLLSTSTLQDDPSILSTAANNPLVLLTGLTRRGLELKVAGSYADLAHYVKTLETALPHLRWGPMQLKVSPQGPELTMRVYILGARS